MGRIDDEQRHVLQTSDLHLATIEALARAIDAKDQTTQMHIRRVQVYATGLANALGLPEPEIQGIKTAALLHDIGKLAVPEHILSKPGPLTQEEFQKIRIHPQVGAEIIAAVPFPYPVAPLILSHHERWDGKGYPQGLAGDRHPARRAHPHHRRLLRRGDDRAAVSQGAQLRERDRPAEARSRARARSDARADVHRDAAVAGRGRSGPSRRRRAAEPAAALPGSTAVGLVPAPSGNAFENIALAHREIYALYEIAQSMGTSLGVSDTMALISSKLSKIVSWSGCALFLHQPDADSLKCRFAAGVDAPRLLNATPQDGPRAVRLGRAQPPHAGQRQPARQLRGGRRSPATSRSTRRSSARCSSTTRSSAAWRSTTSRPNHYTEDHRRLLERDRRAGGRRDPQLDRVRADAGRLADRSADRAAEPPLDVRAPVARAGARRAPQERGRAHRHGHRRVQGDQRHLRPQRRRPRAARGRERAAGRAAALRPVRALRRRRVHRRADRLLARGGRRRSAASCRRASPRSSSRSAPASGSASASAPAPRSSRTTAPPTKSCSPTPITGCTATRPRAAATARSPRPRRPTSSRPTCSTRPSPTSPTVPLPQTLA